MAKYTLIESRAELEALARDLAQESELAFDTEADSFYHYFDKTCLVQVATRRRSFLIDPLALGGPAELAPLGPVFNSPHVRKIFHAAEYDIYVLKRDCGFEFKNLFDTMLSAQLLGYGAVGLSALVEKHFDVSLPKDQQRSDWSSRPLSESQLDYAAADVTYLIRLADKLERQLQRKERMSWAEEEFEAVTRRVWRDRQFDKLGYLRIKGARALDAEGLAILRELYLVRDDRARELDRPPFKVLGNRTLIEIAQRRPEEAENLAQIKGVTELILRRMGREVLAAVKRGIRRPHGPIPRTNGGGRRRLDRYTEERLSRLKRWRSVRASELELDPGVLCPNSALEVIAWGNPKSPDELVGVPELKGWFVREFAAEVVEALGSSSAETRAQK